MTRFAFGAKCGWPSGNDAVPGSAAQAESRPGFNNVPSAAAPRPVAARPKKWRRFISRLRSCNGFMAVDSILGYGLVQIQYYAGYCRPGGQLTRIQIAAVSEAAHFKIAIDRSLILLEPGPLLPQNILENLGFRAARFSRQGEANAIVDAAAVIFT